MSELRIFNSAEFGQIRTVEEKEKILFCAKDVAISLGYKDPTNAIKLHCKGVVKRHLLTGGGKQLTNFIPEGDIYRLAASSELPGAGRFESWIFDEVLPTIRRHGAYMTPEIIEKALTDPDTIIQLATTLKEERAKRKALEAQAEADKPKVLFADAVATAKTSILVGELAKLIKQNGVDIGQNRLFAWLRENGYLIRRNGTDYNMPTQRSMEQGLFEIKETSITNPDGSIRVNKTPKVTGKGQGYFVNLFLGERVG
ncbi:phage antirepressor KilAC domain-containing protein [Pseudoflavonifractor phocaeensis]|uniref:phage antirepressor n=1 Tax=Pseudoflavonifractor phocaeensis TaxID=1870988 RepID=UPI00313AAD02